ncbi:MAG: hypothetical protein NXI04_26735 [Planctomycetaceae bacterium]|nr:hypothetical protein [Planctomycetaceae bacterium]
MLPSVLMTATVLLASVFPRVATPDESTATASSVGSSSQNSASKTGQESTQKSADQSTTVPPQAAAASPKTRPSPSLSAYVQRMMTLDRNKDGFLSAQELPGSLQKLMEHDHNKDGRIGPRELAQIESGAMGQRGGDAAASSAARGDRRGTGPRGNLRNAPQGAAGSPLDPEQVIRFALTFDADHDGGLNAAELRRYAIALAARRARGRRQPAGGGTTPAAPPAASQNTPPAAGLGAPNAKDDPADPFGPPA